MTGNVSKSKNMTLGETPSTAYPGDRGKAVTEDLKAHKEKSVASETGVHNIRLFENSLQFFNGEDWEPTQSGGLTPQITVSAFSGSIVECISEDGKTVITGKSVDGICTINIPKFGTWTIRATYNSTPSYDETIEINEAKIYPSPTVTLTFYTVAGVVWDYGNPNTELGRITPQDDPFGYVTMQVDAEPVAAKAVNEEGYSPFDECYPWKGMELYNIVDGQVMYKDGDEGFSRTAYDTMVYIPKFYYKVVDDPTNKKRYFYISEKPKDEFELHPGSGRFISRYNVSSSGNVLYSKSGAYLTPDLTRTSARNYARSKGEGWYLRDYACWCAVCMLYLVEYGDWNSQDKIGVGYLESTTGVLDKSRPGLSDGMVYHTGGFGQGTSGSVVQYRNIEDPWGNVWEYVDGITFYSGWTFICTNIDSYTDNDPRISKDYIDLGKQAAGWGYISQMYMVDEFPWAFLPEAANGSNASYIPDFVETSTPYGSTVLSVGGCAATVLPTSPADVDIGWGGLFNFSATAAPNYWNASTNARMMFVPKEEVVV